MGLRRLLFLLLFAAAVTLGVASSAPAGNFDEPRMGCTGENPAICPTGTEGQAYSLPIELAGDEDEACAVYAVTSGSLPPGLNLTRSVANETGYGLISGTPTQQGTWDFFLTVTYNREASCPFKAASDDSFRISINPGIPKLTIGPESAPVGTVSAPYSLQMTASVPDQKTWSISSGALPPGLQINSTTGLISGTPTAAGSFPFQVLAKMVSDARSDTKWLTIDIRQPLKITGTGLFGGAGTSVGTGELVRTEVGVPFLATLEASGGSGEYTWTIAQGTLPPGVTMANGNFLGRPKEAGIYRVTISAADTEGRTATFPAVVTVAERLAVATQRMKPGKVGRKYRAKLVATGGVLPKKWKKASGQLPKGLRLDRKLGIVSGTPKKAGRYRVVFEVSDALGVKSKRAFRITVAPAPKKRG